ncbi:hypothetical protein [uncultured Devosia sp.]|uniref:hypothetical protein n=1 Tax=uncultured Devosia sp. TaxID=211434 RepID=UPI0035CA5976
MSRHGALRSGIVLAGLLAGPAAWAASPVGIWEIEMGDSRYRVEMCGDGTQLCGTLIWLGNGADNAENLPYLNTLLIDHAGPVTPNEWQGDLHLFGQTAGGTITQVGDDEIVIEGCVALVICKTYRLFRYGE